MADVVIYHNAMAHPAYVGYIVLPDGSYWGVRFEGETETIVRDKAIRLYESEKAKAKNQPIEGEQVKSLIASGNRGHHFAGKVWMINRSTHDLKRIEPSEIAAYEASGYVRGGPRSK